MPEPMLAVEDQEVSRKTNAVPNLLPCRVHHTGSVDPVSGYWNPVQSEGMNVLLVRHVLLNDSRFRFSRFGQPRLFPR